jgi:hypothetical protein
MNMREKFNQFKEKYEKYIMPAALVIGFFADTITLNKIDQIFDNAILIVHLLIVGTMIAVLFGRRQKIGRAFNVKKYERYYRALMLFSFGGLFSGFVIFYTRSGTLLTSWPFLFTLLILMLGTEIRKTYYQKVITQLTFYYIALFSYLIFFIPLITKKIGPWIFVLSGIVASLMIASFVILLRNINRKKILRYKRQIIIRLVSVLLLFNFFYFTNIIPPIPLSLKFSAVYHEVERNSSGNYDVLYEQTPWYVFWKKRSNRVSWQQGDDVFVFTQVFAPARLNTDIVHSWEYFAPETGEWKPSTKITLSITGGRDEGYRGYSTKSSLREGVWRVVIETSRGQKLGFIRFKIIETSDTPSILQEEV